MITDFREFLMSKYEAKRAHAPKYSLRQFAKEIGLTPSNLSDVLKGRCGISDEVATRITQSLEMNDYEKNLFRDLVVSQHARSQTERDAARKRLEGYHGNPFSEPLAPEQTTVVDKWYYLATLELLALSKGKLDAESMASKLGITSVQVYEAIDTLSTLRLIEQNAEGAWKRTKQHVFAESPVPSARIRGFHRQVLDVAKSGLDQPIPERKYLSTMMAIDSKRLPEIRAFLEEMDKEFFKRFEGSENADCVYNFGLQFFRLDRHDDEGTNETQH